MTQETVTSVIEAINNGNDFYSLEQLQSIFGLSLKEAQQVLNSSDLGFLYPQKVGPKPPAIPDKRAARVIKVSRLPKPSPGGKVRVPAPYDNPSEHPLGGGR